MGGPEALDLSSLFVLASTAAIFSPTVKDQYLELFPNLIIIDAIGSSETGSNGMRMVAKGDTQNKGGGPTVSAARDTVVLDEDLNEVPPGRARGRLARRGNIPLGYYKDPEKSAATFVTGPTGMRYALAGDMAILEEDGTISLLGRGSQCINSGGEKIFPEEVESALKAHPAVFDAIVVGVPDERWGQRVAAVVQPREGESPIRRRPRRPLPWLRCRVQGAQGAPPRRRGGALPQRQARLPVGRQGRPRRDHRLNHPIHPTGDIPHAGPRQALHRRRVGRPRRHRRHRGHLAPHRGGRRPRARGHHRRHRPRRRRRPHRLRRGRVAAAVARRSASPPSSGSATSTPPA